MGAINGIYKKGNIVKNTLIYDVGTGIYANGNTSINIYDTTIHGTTGIVAGSSLSVGQCIFECSLNSISGIAASHLVDTSVLYPDYDYIEQIITPSGCSADIPVFADNTIGEFNPLVGTAENSNYCPSIDLGYRRVSNDVEVTAERQGYTFSDPTLSKDYMNFLYQKNNNVVFSDYKKEVAFAKLVYNKNVTDYSYVYKQKVTLHDVYTKSAFPINPNSDTWPYDWDYETIRTPQIKNISYIVPKSVIDITEALTDVGLQDAFNLNNISITAYKNLDRRGITYDYNNSMAGNMVVWTIDNDQILYMRDIYTGEDIDSYTLLPPVNPSGANLFIKPSGLIPYGSTATGYKFMLENDINTVIEGIDEYGNFEWWPTDKNDRYNVHGILSYKDNLYITANYTTGTTTQPMILVYPSKGYYKDYINPDPFRLYLSDSNKSPRDLTIYEDGTLFVGDNTPTESGIHIHKYKLRYDYALRDNYDKNYVRLYLREQYSDISK